MLEQNIYNLITALICLFLGMIWKKSNFTNLLIKFILIICAMYGGLLVLKNYGFLIKI
jgi:uncharacterized membrane protein